MKIHNRIFLPAVKILLGLSLVAVMAVLLSSCDGPNFRSAEKLLKAPKLTGENLAIQTAFEGAVGTNFTLLTPVTGEYRSSYILKDFDMDGDEECIVLYSVDGDDSSARFNILDKNGDQWVSVADISGPGIGVNSVEFNDLYGDELDEIIITWELIGGSMRSLTVYGGYTAEDLVYGTVKNCVTENYTAFYLAETDNDAKDEIFIVLRDTVDNSFVASARLLNYDTKEKKFCLVGECSLDPSASDYKSIKFQKKNGLALFYIDEIVGSAAATELVLLSDDGLSVPYETVADTLRSQDRMCADYTGDGIIDIPVSVKLPGGVVYSDGEEKNASLDGLSRATTDGLVLTSTYLNVSELGFDFDFPDEWQNRITVQLSVDAETLTFYNYDEQSAQTGFRLFTIARQSEDSKIHSEDVLLAKKDGYAYVLQITADGENAGIQAEYIKEKFSLR